MITIPITVETVWTMATIIAVLIGLLYLVSTESAAYRSKCLTLEVERKSVETELRRQISRERSVADNQRGFIRELTAEKARLLIEIEQLKKPAAEAKGTGGVTVV